MTKIKSKHSAKMEILQKVKEISKIHPSGEKFFDALDKEISKTISIDTIKILFSMVSKNYFIVLSGGFGKSIVEKMNNGDLPKLPFFLFNGGIRSGNPPSVIDCKFQGIGRTNGIFLDDSIYGGATYEAIKRQFNGHQTLKKCAVIYDGCPIQKNEITSIFRYYDYFKATPNYTFSE